MAAKKRSAAARAGGAQAGNIELSKRLGQHFLLDRGALEYESKIIDIAGMDVLEIGPGDGRLSELLLAQKPSKLILIEIDRRWADYLARKFAKEKNVQIINTDFLEIDDGFDVHAIIGNIPYNISSKILLKLAKMKFLSALLCMQKEVVQRICAPPASEQYGRLSVFCQLNFVLKPMMQIPKESFKPVPKVDSQIVQLVPKNQVKLPKNIERTTSALFSHRLAAVSNALFHSRKMFGWNKEEAKKIGRQSKFANKKVFMLSPDEVLQIAIQLQKVSR